MVAKVIDEAHDKLQFALSERQSLREKKLVLECLMKIPSSLDHLEKLLINASSIETMCEMEESENPTDVGSVMERAGNELNRLQHLLVKCHYTSTVVTDLQKVRLPFRSIANGRLFATEIKMNFCICSGQTV